MLQLIVTLPLTGITLWLQCYVQMRFEHKSICVHACRTVNHNNYISFLPTAFDLCFGYLKRGNAFGLSHEC